MAQYWIERPLVLTESTQLWLTDTMPFNEKLNAITRLVIVLTILGFVATRNMKLVVGAFATLAAISLLWYSKRFQKEGFEHTPLRPETFTEPTDKNPLMNVMYNDDPDRPRAAPSFDPEIEHQINQKAKKIVTDGDEALEAKLFDSLGDDMEFKHSMRAFHPTANTQIPNDQEAFLRFCYPKTEDSL